MDTYDRLLSSGRVFTVKIDSVGHVQGYDVTIPDGAIRVAQERQREADADAMSISETWVDVEKRNLDRRVQEEEQMSRVREQQAHAQKLDEELGNL